MIKNKLPKLNVDLLNPNTFWAIINDNPENDPHMEAIQRVVIKKGYNWDHIDDKHKVHVDKDGIYKPTGPNDTFLYLRYNKRTKRMFFGNDMDVLYLHETFNHHLRYTTKDILYGV